MAPHLFQREMEQIRSYDDFDEKYGLICPTETNAEFAVSGNWSFLVRPRHYDGKLQNEWRIIKDDLCDMIDGHDGVGFPTERTIDFPADAPEEILKSWQAQLRDDFARRMVKVYETAVHATPPIPVANVNEFQGDAYGLKDKQLKAKFIEEMWRDGKPVSTSSRHEFTKTEFDLYFTHGLFAHLQQVFDDVGHPETAAAMIAEAKKGITITVDPTDATRAAALSEETQYPRIVSVNLLPPELSPDMRSIIFPSTTANGVVALKTGGGALWVSTRGGAMTLGDSAWEYLTSSHTNANLWRLASGGRTPVSLSDGIGNHSKITSFCVQDDKLWMTLEQGGVCRLTPADSKETLYGDKEGVLSKQMFASALMGNRLFFGGGEPRNGKLNYVELPGLVWKSQNLASGEQIKVLQPLAHHLLVNNQVLDVNNGGWRSLDFDVLGAAVDSKTFWLGTRRGLVSYDPESGAKHEWRSVKGGYYVDAEGKPGTNAAPTSRLPGAVTALANDGDFLWIGTTTRFDRSLDGNGNKGGWVNGYYGTYAVAGNARNFRQMGKLAELVHG